MDAQIFIFSLWFFPLFFLDLLLIMPGVDLNEPINWDDLDDFEGEAQELAGDFFFEVESDEGKPSTRPLKEHFLSFCVLDNNTGGWKELCNVLWVEYPPPDI